MTCTFIQPRALASAAALAALCGSALAAPLAQSNFNSSTEGWTAFANTSGVPSHPVAWTALNGGMLVHYAPSDGGTSFFRAPSSFVGALAGAIGGTISYDIGSVKAQSTDTFFTHAQDVEIRAGSQRIRTTVFADAPGFPDTEHVSLKLDTSHGWNYFNGTSTTVATQLQIDAILASATAFTIRAEYWSNTLQDITYLDNVVISGVPEPQAYAMLLLGLAGLSWVRRRG